jgi:hypothetical protein
MAAEVAEAWDLPRGAGFFISLCFSVTVKIKFSGEKPFVRFVKGWRIYQMKLNNPLKSLKIFGCHLDGPAKWGKPASGSKWGTAGHAGLCRGTLRGVKSNGHKFAASTQIRQ